MKSIVSDKIDNTILAMLSQNARLSYVEIGKAVGLSSVAVKKRIEALEEQGIIEGYSIIVNPLKASEITSMFFDISVSCDTLYEAAEILRKDEHITQVYLLTGNAKLHVHGMFSSSEDRASFLKNVLYTLPGLVDVSTYDIVERIKDVRSIRL